MSTRPAAALAAAMLAASLVVLSVAPASALISRPPPGDPPDRPTTTQRTPGTTTSTTTLPTLQSLTVTTDSVVATATVRFNRSPGVVSVQWGDGTSNSRNPDDPTESPNPDPPGTIVFRHRYAAPGDGAAFATTITAQASGETQTRAVIVTPRYLVTQSPARLETLGSCDTRVEQYTEWRIVRRGGSLANKTWEFDQEEPGAWIGDYPGQTHPLPGSAVSFELTGTEREVLEYQVSEVDLIFDDLGQTYDIDFDPILGSRPVVLDYHDFSGCWARILTDVNVALLTPGLGGGGGPVATQ